MDTVTTRRLIVRCMTEADLPDYLAYMTHPESRRYSPGPATNEAKASKFIARQVSGEAEFASEGYFAFAVALAGENRMIGEVGLGFSPDKPEQGEMGWSIHPDFHRRGYATEAARVLLRYAFEERQFHRVRAGCDIRNTPSYKLMERLGMRREAHFRASHFTDGAWQDEVIYALLRDEWLARPTE